METRDRARVVPGALLGLLAAAGSGCVYGQTTDAVSGDGIPAKVSAYGYCRGEGCTTDPNGATGWFEITGTNDGIYVFDAYGDMAGDEESRWITPASGRAAITLKMSRTGYTTRTVFHTPKYEEYTNNEGKKYLYSSVPHVRLCKTGALDTDADSICDAAEARYGTDPTKIDTDGDNLSDAAELFGANGIDLRYYGADPLHKDVFVEIDYYATLKPMQSALDMVVAAYAAAPVTNPDGKTGITLHVVLDDAIAGANVDNDLNPVWNDFDVIKTKYFDSRLQFAFHYLLWARQYDGGTSSGISRSPRPNRDLIVTLGTSVWDTPAGTPGGTELEQAGTFMHELGHNMGLGHGGNDSTNYKPNYLSIMSYLYQTVGLRRSGATVLDYSRDRVAALSETGLSEPNAMAPTGGTTEAQLANYGVRVCTARDPSNAERCTSRVWLTGNASQNLDFNRDGDATDTGLTRDLDGDRNTTDAFAASQNDWTAMSFRGISGDSLIPVPLNAPTVFMPEPPCMDQPDRE